MVDTEYGTSGFQLQARTERALDKDDQPTQATVFSAFAAKDNGTRTIQVQMSPDKKCKYCISTRKNFCRLNLLVNVDTTRLNINTIHKCNLFQH